MYVIMVPFTTYATTPTRIVNVSKWNLLKVWGVEDPGLWRICPKEYRHLLHDERRQELKKNNSLTIYFNGKKKSMYIIFTGFYNIYKLPDFPV